MTDSSSGPPPDPAESAAASPPGPGTDPNRIPPVDATLGGTETTPEDAKQVGHTAARIGRAFGLQMVGRILATVASLVTVALTTRHLGPENYGYITAAVMFVTLWLALTELGIGEIVVRRVTAARNADAQDTTAQDTGDQKSGAQDTAPQSVERLIRISLGFAIVWSLPLTAIALGTGVFIYRDDPQIVKMLFIVVGSIALTTLYSSFDPVFNVHMRFGAVAIADVGGRLLSLAMTVVLVATDASLGWFAAVQLIPPAVFVVVKGIAAARLGRIAPIFAVRETRSLLIESFPVTVVLIIAVLYWRLDGVLLSVLSSAEQVGHYGLAYSVAFMITMVSDVLLTSLLSTTTALYSADRPAFAAFIARTSAIMYFFAVPIAVVGPILAGSIVTFISSDDFADGAPVLGFLFVAAALTFLNAAASQALFAAHDQHFLMRLNAATLVGNIVANIILIPMLGAEGAAIAMVGTEAVGYAVSRWRLARRKLFHEPITFVVRLIVPAAVAAAIAFVLRDANPLISLPAAAIGYLLVNIVVGPVNRGFIRTLRDRDAQPSGDRAAPSLPGEG